MFLFWMWQWIGSSFATCFPWHVPNALLWDMSSKHCKIRWRLSEKKIIAKEGWEQLHLRDLVVSRLRSKFSNLLVDTKKQEKNYDKFFMLLTLVGLPFEFDNLHQYLLVGASIPSIEDAFAKLLWVTLAYKCACSTSIIVDSSIFASNFVVLLTSSTRNSW